MQTALGKPRFSPKSLPFSAFSKFLTAAILLAFARSSPVLGAAPKGASTKPSDAEQAAMTNLGKELKALIVWSTSRVSGNHDLFIMNADGTGERALTKNDNVDWYPRFSPDGKQVLFCRSKSGWASEGKTDHNEMWDTFVINTDGTGEKKLVSDALWGTWIDGGKILYSRNDKIYTMDLTSGEEKVLCDSKDGLPGAVLQQPELSPDGKYLAMTLRGRRRETGILNLEKKEWTKTGEGCEVNWFPSADRIFWVNPSGNGGSEIFAAAVKDGKLADPGIKYDKLKWVDLPGKQSHEYFCKLSQDGKWLVWCATIFGHEHDIYDYDVFCWKVGAPIEQAVRLTFHTGNDRWPDIFVMQEPAKADESSKKEAEKGVGQ